MQMVMLKNIPRILSPQLLSVLARMGHGDEIGNNIARYHLLSRDVCVASLANHTKSLHWGRVWYFSLE